MKKKQWKERALRAEKQATRALTLAAQLQRREQGLDELRRERAREIGELRRVLCSELSKLDPLSIRDRERSADIDAKDLPAKLAQMKARADAFEALCVMAAGPANEWPRSVTATHVTPLDHAWYLRLRAAKLLARD